MKKLMRAVLSIALLSIVTTAIGTPKTAGCTTVKHYIRRSDSRHKPRQLVGDYRFTHIRDAESFYGLLSIMPAYSTSFRSEKILNCLLGGCMSEDNCCYGRAIKIQGSAVGTYDDLGNVVSERDRRAWLADYFYLPRNYNGSFSVKPIIKTFTLNFDFYLGLDGMLRGLYLRAYGPLAHSRWDLNFCDRNTTAGDPMSHSCGYFSPAAYPGENLVQSFCDYMKGAVPTTSTGNEDIIFNPIKYAKMSPCTQTATGFADLRMELGYDLFNCPRYRLGVNIQNAFPTGVQKKPCYLFDAMVGNGNHWELGGGINGHFCLWESDEEDRNFKFVFDANITTMFENQQCRTFEICGKANSAYMLAAKFGSNPENEDNIITGQLLENPQVGYGESNSAVPVAESTVSLPSPDRRFALEYSPVANLSTLKVDVRTSVHADVVAMFNYNCGDFSWDLGYNFWARSCEKICANARCNAGTLYDPALENSWTLKGDARMFGFQGATQDTLAVQDPLTPVPLSATQSAATIYSGTNQVQPKNLVENNNMTVIANNATGNDVNLKVDSAEYAFTKSPIDVGGTNVGPLSLSCDAARFSAGAPVGRYLDLAVDTDQIKTSSEPQFLSCKSIDLTRTKGTSHALFSNISWHCVRDWGTPYIGLGCSVEFGNGACDNCCDNSTCGADCPANTCVGCCTSCCPCCIDCAVAQWTIWIKGGVAFGKPNSL